MRLPKLIDSPPPLYQASRNSSRLCPFSCPHPAQGARIGLHRFSETSSARRQVFGLIFAALITLVHTSISFCRNRLSSSGVLAIGSAPCAASCSVTAGD